MDLEFTGTATLTDDYTRSGVQVVIAPGSLTGSVTVTAVQDPDDELNETVAVAIAGVINGTESGVQQAVTTIVDDDATVQIIDNGDASGFSLSGDWALGGGPGVGRIGNVHQAYGESFLTNVDMATWTFNLIGGPGQYRVSATWFTNTDPMFNPLWSLAAAYEVSDGAMALGTALINQRLTPSEHAGSFNDSGSDWANLGEFDITGSTLTVRLRSGFDDKYVIADAIRIERIADLPGAAEIHVTVADNGPGLPDADRDRLFQPFFTTRSDGTGLGLALVQKFIVTHNGQVRATNRPEGGAAFTVWLPLRPPDASRVQ